MRAILTILCFLAVIIPGVCQGLMTDRWYVSTQLEDFTARVNNVPADFKGWQSEDVKLDPRQVAQADLSAYVARRYTHNASGLQLNMLLTCGRSGPMSVHSPDICYGGIGFKMHNAENKIPVKGSAEGSPDEFYDSTFVKAGPVPEFLEIYWGWNSHGTWEVPKNPRVAFGGQPALYKLYVVCPFSKESQRKEMQDACQSFFDVLLPELRKTLFITK